MGEWISRAHLCKALPSKWRLAAQDWPSITEAIQIVLKYAPLKRVCLRNANSPDVYRTPFELFKPQTRLSTTASRAYRKIS